MQTIERDKRGFTLVELMVTLVISSIAFGAIYGVYKAQLQSHVTQNALVDTQQGLRNTFYIMQRTIRMAGFDPTGDLRSLETDGRQRRGVHGRFKELCEDGRVTGACGAGYLNAVSGASAIAFALNDNATLFAVRPDGIKTCLSPYPAGNTSCVQLEALDSELVAFRLNGSTIEQYGPWTGWKTIAENIESLTFEYLDDQGRHIGPEGVGESPPPGDPLPLPPNSDKADKWLTLNDNLRSVRITIEAKAIADSHNPLINSKSSNSAHNRTLTAQVRIRNSGIE